MCNHWYENCAIDPLKIDNRSKMIIMQIEEFTQGKSNLKTVSWTGSNEKIIYKNIFVMVFVLKTEYSYFLLEF